MYFFLIYFIFIFNMLWAGPWAVCWGRQLGGPVRLDGGGAGYGLGCWLGWAVGRRQFCVCVRCVYFLWIFLCVFLWLFFVGWLGCGRCCLCSFFVSFCVWFLWIFFVCSCGCFVCFFCVCVIVGVFAFFLRKNFVC